jgi:hypothetical protein
MHGRLQHGVRIARLEWDSRCGADRELVMRLLPKLGPRRFGYNELSRGVLCVISWGAMRQVATDKSLDAGANYSVSDGKAVLTFTTSAIAGQVARVTRCDRYSRVLTVLTCAGPLAQRDGHHHRRRRASRRRMGSPLCARLGQGDPCEYSVSITLPQPR